MVKAKSFRAALLSARDRSIVDTVPVVKNLPASAGDAKGCGSFSEKDMATHSSIFTWKIP